MYGLLVNVGSHQFSEPLHALTNLLSVPLPTIRWGKYSLMSHWLGVQSQLVIASKRLS